MLSRISPIYQIIYRDYCFLQTTLLWLKFPMQIHAKESYNGCNRSACLFALFTASKSRVVFFNRNQTACLSKFYDKMFYIMQIISLHSSYTWLAHYRGFCYAIVISDGRGNKVCQHATTRRTFVDEIYRQEYCSCAVLCRSIISCRAYPCHICWMNVARGSRLAARVRKIVQLVEKIMYDCSLLPIHNTRGKTLWRRSCPLHLFSCFLQR